MILLTDNDFITLLKGRPNCLGHHIGVGRRRRAKGKLRFFYVKRLCPKASRPVHQFTPLPRRTEGTIGLNTLVTIKVFEDIEHLARDIAATRITAVDIVIAALRKLSAYKVNIEHRLLNS